MRNIKIILTILFVISGFSGTGFYSYTGEIPQETTYYVSTTGNDENDGSIDNPWLTIAHAVTTVNGYGPGNNIYINNGIYNVSTQQLLGIGIDITGQSQAGTIINSSYGTANQALFKLETASGWLGDYGNQTISNLTIDGNNTTYRGIQVNFRSHVTIDHVTINDCVHAGVIFYGFPSYTPWTAENIFEDDMVMPDHFCVGNKLTNSTLYNNASGNYANLCVGQQDALEVDNCYIEQPIKGSGGNCGGVKFFDDGYNKFTKFHDSEVIVEPNPSNDYNFSMEIWYELGGCEYWGNVFRGTVDLNLTDKGTSTYGSYWHDNEYGFNDYEDRNWEGMDVEAICRDLIISNNYFHHVSTGIQFSMIYPIGGHTQQNVLNRITVTNNLMINLGMSDGTSDWEPVQGIMFWNDGAGSGYDTVKNVIISHNTIHCGSVTPNSFYVIGTWLPDMDIVVDNFDIQNNIYYNWDGASVTDAPIRGSGAVTLSGSSLTHNVFFACGNSNAPLYVSGYTPLTASDNQTTDPGFMSESDYHITDDGSAYHNGITLSGQIYDYDDVLWNHPPSIGALEMVPKHGYFIRHLGKTVRHLGKIVKY